MKNWRGRLVYVECVELVLIWLTDSGDTHAKFASGVASATSQKWQLERKKTLPFFCFFFVFIRMDKVYVARGAQNTSIHEYFYVRSSSFGKRTTNDFAHGCRNGYG